MTSGSRTATEEATIHLRGTHKFFDGDLFIHFIDEKFYGAPIGHKITARIWSTRKEEITIKNKSVGFSILYTAKAKYRIRIKNAQLTNATFEVVRL
jgi:hypothetical protein